MQERLKKPISIFLLWVFCFVAAPPALWHHFFSHHADTEANYCRFYHKDLGTHIENTHRACAILKTQTPLYDVLIVQPSLQIFRVVVSVQIVLNVLSKKYLLDTNISARAPPLV
ncbi:MAG: hypothetical protein JST67_06285 [Bacteroidetes bacterium]|nr:hypothetical protein [Bacteroidota bacterium]